VIESPNAITRVGSAALALVAKAKAPARRLAAAKMVRRV